MRRSGPSLQAGYQSRSEHCGGSVYAKLRRFFRRERCSEPNPPLRGPERFVEIRGLQFFPAVEPGVASIESSGEALCSCWRQEPARSGRCGAEICRRHTQRVGTSCRPLSRGDVAENQCAVESPVRSHSVPRQLEMVPLFPQTGHAHSTNSVFGEMSVSTTPAHRFFPGWRKQPTFGVDDFTEDELVASTTSEARNSANCLAGLGIVGAIAPSSVRKCERSVTYVLMTSLS